MKCQSKVYILSYCVEKFKAKPNKMSNKIVKLSSESHIIQKPVGHWSLGLVHAMKDPKQIIKQDERVVVIADTYPKASWHVLVMPKEDLVDLSALRREHVPLLRHMAAVGYGLLPTQKVPGMGDGCLMGYHAVPSVQRLHLHVLTDDLSSPCLKTKQHWNSYTTSFFITSDDLISRLEKYGRIERVSSEEHKRLKNTPLKCHRCSFYPRNMPELKKHILSHLPN